MALVPAALLPANEAERLRSLHHYDILHSLQEEVFDEFVGLTARIFSLPISLLTLVDAHEVAYKALHGMPRSLPDPRVEMLCSMVIKQNQVVVYHDLTAAPQTAINAQAIQAALTKKVRFYAAAPLRMPDQHSIGALCLLDRQPRAFSPEEQDVLQQLADLVSQLIALRHHYRSTPALGEARWQVVRTQVRDEVHALGALVRYLLTRYGAITPVPEDVLHLVARRLHDLRSTLQECE